MSYKRTVWVNDSLPAINAENLNKIENGIAESNIFRNLFNKNVIGYNLSGASKSIVNEAIRITSLINGTNSSVAYLIPFGRKELLGKTITLSGSWISSANKNGRMYIGACDEDFTNRHSYIVLENSGESVTVTLPTLFADNNVRFFLALYACYDENIAIDDYVDYTNVQIEENTEATEYTPFAGYIVESGSNENGSWVKYSDGTLIQYGSIQNNISITVLSNSGKYYYQDDISLILPIRFANDSYYSNVIPVNNQNGSQNVYSVRNKTQSKFDFCLSSLISYSSNNNTFWWFAIGRWK